MFVDQKHEDIYHFFFAGGPMVQKQDRINPTLFIFMDAYLFLAFFLVPAMFIQHIINI